MKLMLILFSWLLLTSLSAANPEPIKFTWPLVLALVVGIYEAVVRIIPTAGQWGVVGKIIEILSWLSNFLNRKK